MSIIEIRCPRCGSICSSKGKKENEYHCEHCGTSFVFMDTSKKEVVHDKKIHHCRACGIPIEDSGNYKCVFCGKEDFCQECIIKATVEKPDGSLQRIFFCNDCEKEYFRLQGKICSVCGEPGDVTVCGVCGRKFCDKHDEIMLLDSRLHFCDHCRDELEWGLRSFNLCGDCVTRKQNLFGKVTYHCKRCGSEAISKEPWPE